MDLLEIVDDGKNMLFPIGVTTEDTDLFTKDFHEFLKETI